MTVGAGVHDVQGEAAKPGLIQHEKKVVEVVITVFSYLIGGQRLFLELHSRRTRGNGTELHLKMVVKHQNKDLER